MTMKIKDILPNPNNPRTLNKDKFAKLKNSIKEFPKMMELRPMVLDENNVVLGGNMRLQALKELGYKEVPDAWVKKASELTADEKRQFIIKDNVGFGEWDWELLANEWDADELQAWGLELNFDTETEIEAEEDNYTVPDEIHTDIVQGDLIEIGEHRLLCGDSTNSDDVEKLMNGEKADMVFTDPPYGVEFQSGARTEKFEVLKNDDKMLTEWIPNVHLFSKGFVFVWCSWKVVADWIEITKEIGELSNVVIWAKRASGMGDLKKTFSTDYEVALVFHRGCELKGKRCGSVWDIMRDDVNSYMHPTQKPIQLASKAIESTTAVKDIILDFFLGSGSTMAAAHQLKRKCYGMELDAKYCQVIIDRMLKLDATLVVKINGKEYKPADAVTEI